MGTAPITGGSATTGTATLSVPIPAGLVRPGTGHQYVDVVASYSGDPHHFASTSSKFRVTFAPLGFCVQPTGTNLANGQEIVLVAGGAVPPVRWMLLADDTCNSHGRECSTLNGQPAGGAYVTVGPEWQDGTGPYGNVTLVTGTGGQGYVWIQAVDGAGQETYVDLSVGTFEDAGGIPWGDDAGVTSIACPFVLDAGPLPSLDAGVDSGTTSEDSGSSVTPGEDSGTTTGGNDGGSSTAPPDSGSTVGPADAATASDGGGGSPSSSSGCSCKAAGRDTGAPGGTLGGVLLGLGLIARRRRSRR
jgi:MYXO-CTERM domain-containing protein